MQPYYLSRALSARVDISSTPIVIEVNRSLSPRGADRFYELVNDHFYDNSALFRVVPDFVLQVINNCSDAVPTYLRSHFVRVCFNSLASPAIKPRTKSGCTKTFSMILCWVQTARSLTTFWPDYFMQLCSVTNLISMLLT